MDEKKLLRYVLDMGQDMLLCGAEVSRVEDTITRLLKSYGAAEVDVMTIPSGITLSASFKDDLTETQLRRIWNGAYDTDFTRLSMLNELSRRICAQKPPVDALGDGIRAIRENVQHRNRKDLSRLAGYFLAGSAFAVFFGGSLWDGLASVLTGVLIYLLDGLLKRVHMQRLLQAFLISLLTGLFAMSLPLLSPVFHPSYIMIGSIMLLIPGIAMTNSVRDMLTGDTISGTLRLVESLLIACFIAGGFATAMLLTRNIQSPAEADTLARLPFVQILSAALGSLGFSLIFRVPYKNLFFCTLGSGLCWSVYLLCMPLLGESFAAQALAALFGAGYAELMARITRAPATVYNMPVLIALIPGRGLYYTMEAMVRSSRQEVLTWGTATAISALAIAVGIVAVAALLTSLRTFSRANRIRRARDAS